MAMTNREKQQALRERRAKEGKKELRGLWVTLEEAKEIKPKILKMVKEIRKGKG